MKTDILLLILSLITLTVNYTTMFLTFPRKYSKLVSFGMPILFMLVLYIPLYITELYGYTLGGWRGLLHLPVILLLLKGQFLQKLFAFFFQMVFTGLQIYIARIIAQAISGQSGDGSLILMFVLALVMFAVYVTLIFFYGRRIFERLFINGRRGEWTLYSFGAVFSFVIISISSKMLGFAYQLTLLLFVFWSFAILCFAIINTHEKTKKTYEADFARDIISSGREHYQKMNEMYNTLRYLRHDYKYHLNTIGELLNSGDKDEIEKYLKSITKQLSENELSNYCKNPVINALLASYNERSSKLGIKYEVDVSMPENLSIGNYELCIILGNLLENAVDACQKLAELRQEDNRKIELVVRPLGTQLALKVVNSFDGMVIQDEGEPASTKSEGGFGLKSVQAVAVQYSGELITEWDDKTFTAYVVMGL